METSLPVIIPWSQPRSQFSAQIPRSKTPRNRKQKPLVPAAGNPGTRHACIRLTQSDLQRSELDSLLLLVSENFTIQHKSPKCASSLND